MIALFPVLTFSRYGDLRAGGNRPDGYEEFGRRLFYVDRIDNIDQVIENVTDGGNPNYDLQIGTAYSQMDFMQKIKYQPNKQFYTVLNFQHSTSTDVPRYDNLAELTDPTDPSSLRYAEWLYGPQRRLLASLKSRWSKPTTLYDRMTLIGSFQRIHESRLNRILNKSLRNFQLENVYVSSLTLDLDKKLDETGRQKIMYGLDANHNHVRSESGKVRITNESLTRNAITRYPANNDVVSLAAYAKYVWQMPDTSLTLHAGLRYNWVNLHSQYSPDSTIFWPANYIDPGVGSTNSDVAWSFGATWRNNQGTSVRALVSKAFRSPNIDDYSQLRPRNNFMSVPNPGLQPERTYNGEIGIGQEFGRIRNGNGTAFRIDLTGYFTYARGLMTRRAFALPDGSNTVVLDGLTFQTRAMVNANRAYIYGSEAFAQLRVGDKWSLESKLSFVRGNGLFGVEDANGQVVFDTLGPIDHIPPVHGFTRLGYTTDKFQLSLAVRYQGKKPVDRYGASGVELDENGNATLDPGGTEDNLEYSYYRIVDGEQVFDGTLAWTTYNFYSSWHVSPWLTLDVAVENIFDLHYRPFSSGVSAPGRNFIVSARFNFVN